MEIHPFGSQGKLFMRNYLAGGTVLLNYPKGELKWSCWLFLTVKHCYSQVLEKCPGYWSWALEKL